MRFSYILLFISWSSFGQLVAPPIDSPPNGIKLNDSIYLDATEIANIHWLEFLYYIKKDSSETFWQSILPDTTLLEKYRPFYLRHPTYRYHPVVGITRNQALHYCRWRSLVVNLKLERQDADFRLNYRLPTEEEWEVGARTIDSVSYTSPKTCFTAILMKSRRREIKKIFPERDIDYKELRTELINYSESEVLSFVLDFDRPWFIIGDEKQPQSVYYYEEKSADLKYSHLIGNVAEMVDEPGIVKGGSWKHKLAVSFPSKQIPVDPKKAYDWVGFRCVADVLPVKD